MITADSSLDSIRQEAIQRQARQRVDVLDEMRAVKNALDRGLTQRPIAELLMTSQARVSRLLKAIERRGGDLSQDPEEIILRTTAYDTDRTKMVADLKGFHYTFGEEAPYPHEGRIPGTWDQVVSCYAQKMLTDEEFNEIRRAVGR
ncbi:helix-turn-helix domain-containing protein [Arthrobacter sp. A2-55]|uniref:helix-turn-helix domain-containing protein n=1 Tax=Arthrobacter sp. A2-55 TaxID=2897337 RepID=UPI0021CD7B08|nr:helix-turn-helix domain-containing protein [Arthrobacter sp. A2-55]MCU6479038.1 helix-turn-helix domain-containing protein [Arthrobacter sp. A2-55]